MSIYKIAAHLLEYPTDELWLAKEELLDVIATDTELDLAQQQRLVTFINNYFSQSVLSAQSEYYQTFDVGHMTSLLLFEHVYGDSRERGQAMVDLIEQYKQVGLALSTKQLPDYLPIFLEYLSLLPSDEAQTQLHDIALILRLLTLRLEKKQSRFAELFALLYALSKYQFDDSELKNKVQQEPSDTTKDKLDKIWQEEQVRFQSSPTVDRKKINNATYYVNVGEDKRSQL